MSDESKDPGAELSVELLDWLFTRTQENRLILTVLGKTIALLACQMKPEWMSWPQQRKAFTKALSDELKRAAKFVETNKKH